MIKSLAFLLAALQQQPDIGRDYGIYKVTANTEVIEYFVEELENWEGGYHFLTETQGETSTATFAAYPHRTAPQSRVFIFGAMRLGIQPEILSYNEHDFYPEERTRLDNIASDCGVDPGIAFIAPGKTLHLGGPKILEASYESVDCFLEAVKPFQQDFESIGFIGNEATVEESN